MKREYALEQLSALELHPLRFVDVAAEAGYDAIGLHLEGLPVQGAASYSLISDADLFNVMKRRIADSGLRLHVIEPFLIAQNTTRDSLLRNLDLGARLGATVAGTLVFDSDVSRRTERLAQHSEDARARGLMLTIEPYLESSLPTLSEAVAAAVSVGASTGVTLDVLHVIRGGEYWDAVSKLAPGMISTIQLCDGTLAKPSNWPISAITDRAIPGEGEFGLSSLIPLLPIDVPIGIEVPSLRLAEQMPALPRMRKLLERTQALFTAG